jgi:hypothetical protein
VHGLDARRLVDLGERGICERATFSLSIPTSACSFWFIKRLL